MNLVTNGFPKAGNHALVKACELLGVPAKVDHINAINGWKGLPEGTTHHIFIKRDPRNILLSWLRFTGKQQTPGMFLTSLIRFQSKSFAEELAEYESWLHDSNTLVVKYEDLIANDTEMKRIAAYLMVDYIPGAFEDLPGYTTTWHADHSDWQKMWTPQMTPIWNVYGGIELLARWGYL